MKPPYSEGSVFAVPLRSGGYGIGVIARVSKNNSGGLLGYFFEPKFATLPSSEIIDSLSPSKAIKVLMFGDLLLLDKTWSIIGNIAGWRREDWSIPDYVQKDDISKKAWRVRYADDDVNKVISLQPEPFDSPLERNSLYGAGAVELLLTRLLV